MIDEDYRGLIHCDRCPAQGDLETAEDRGWSQLANPANGFVTSVSVEHLCPVCTNPRKNISTLVLLTPQERTNLFDVIQAALQEYKWPPKGRCDDRATQASRAWHFVEALKASPVVLGADH